MNSSENMKIKASEELSTMRKNAQNDAERILELKSMIDTIDSENDELRATIGKQRALGFVSLVATVILALLLVLDGKLLFWM